MQTLDIAKVNKSKKLLGLRNKKGEHISSKNTIPIIKSARKRQFSLLVNDEVEQVVITGTEAEKKRFKKTPCNKQNDYISFTPQICSKNDDLRMISADQP